MAGLGMFENKGLEPIQKFTIKEILGKKLKPAIFQRGKVWMPENKEYFLESIYLGVPCGVFIFNKNNEGGYDIIDGQQRINCLQTTKEKIEDNSEVKIWCINLMAINKIKDDLEITGKRNKIFSLRTDIWDNTGNTIKKNVKDSFNFIPLSKFLDSKEFNWEGIKFNKNIAPEDIEPKKKEIINKVTKDIGNMFEYEFPVYILKKEVDGLQSYIRTNCGGKRVETEEVEYAYLVNKFKETTGTVEEIFDFIHDIGEDRAELKRMKEFNLGLKFFINVFNLVSLYNQNGNITKNVISPTNLERISWLCPQKTIPKVLERSKKILHYLANKEDGIITNELYCDDLRYIPEAKSLYPIIYLLAACSDESFEMLKTEQYKKTIAYLILGIFLLNDDNLWEKLLLNNSIRNRGSIEEYVRNICKEIGSNCKDKMLIKKIMGDQSQGINKMSMNNHYTKMLYWLLRKEGVHDFSYNENTTPSKEDLLEEIKKTFQKKSSISIIGRKIDDRTKKRRELMIKEQEERISILNKNVKDIESGRIKGLILSKYVDSQKGHLYPYSEMKKLYLDAIEDTHRKDKHEINNIGNLSYISTWLNSGTHGMNKSRVNYDLLDKENFDKHYITDNLEENPTREKFETFVKERQEKIADGFKKWLDSLSRFTCFFEGINIAAPFLDQKDIPMVIEILEVKNPLKTFLEEIPKEDIKYYQQENIASFKIGRKFDINVDLDNYGTKIQFLRGTSSCQQEIKKIVSDWNPRLKQPELPLNDYPETEQVKILTSIKKHYR